MAKASVTSYTGENVFSLMEDKMMRLTEGNKLQTPSDVPILTELPLAAVDIKLTRALEIDKLFDSFD